MSAYHSARLCKWLRASRTCCLCCSFLPLTLPLTLTLPLHLFPFFLFLFLYVCIILQDHDDGPHNVSVCMIVCHCRPLSSGGPMSSTIAHEFMSHSRKPHCKHSQTPDPAQDDNQMENFDWHKKNESPSTSDHY